MSFYKFAKNSIRILLLSMFLILLFFFLDKEFLMDSGRRMLQNPITIFIVISIYFLSFFLKGIAWKMYLNDGVRLTSCLYGLFYSLLFNHLFPLKVGDGLRVMIMNNRETHISVEKSFHSVFVLRIMDTMSLLIIVLIGLPFFTIPFSALNVFFIFVITLFVGAFILKKMFPAFFTRHWQLLTSSLSGKNGFVILSLIFFSWILEGAILFGVSGILEPALHIGVSIWVNSVTILGQLFQFAPGGIATYESVMSYTLFTLGIPLEIGLSMAIFSHGIKFIFSYLIGGLVILLSPVSLKNVKQWIKMKGRN